MSIVSQTCTATGFMTTIVPGYARLVRVNTDNIELRERLLPKVAESGAQLGGTGLNPMKTLRYRAASPEGEARAGRLCVVRGVLPWVSNLGADHVFGAICEVEDDSQRVMFLADCAGQGVTLKPCEPFLAMDGMGTYADTVQDASCDSVVLARRDELCEKFAPASCFCNSAWRSASCAIASR